MGCVGKSTRPIEFFLSQVATWPAELFFHFHFSDSFVPIPVPTDNENGLHYQCALLFTIWIWTDNCAVTLSVRVIVGLRKVHLGLHFFIPQSCVSHVYRTERNGSKVVVILECHCKNANTIPIAFISINISVSIPTESHGTHGIPRLPLSYANSFASRHLALRDARSLLRNLIHNFISPRCGSKREYKKTELN